MNVQPLETVSEPILIDGLSWQDFKTVEPLLDRPGVRLSFLAGVLEIRKVPGEKHETIKERIGLLLDLYLLQMGIDYTPTGSVTLENESEQVRQEADKSYKLGADRTRPDLAIEVVTSGGINQLEAYKRLNISEVWFWQNSKLSLYALRNQAGDRVYEEMTKSEILPELNIDLFVGCFNIPNHIQAIREFRQAI